MSVVSSTECSFTSTLIDCSIQEEIKETLKRERRRAEKALARQKKYVCFNCRQPGHELSECPETAASGGPKRPAAATSSGKICFKVRTVIRNWLFQYFLLL